MAKQINIIANLIDKQLKKQLQALQNGKYNINVNVNNANVGQTSNQVHQLSKSANSANTAFGKLGSTISETFSTSRMTMTAFLAVMNEIRKAGKNAQQTIQELDKAITDLSIATNMSREETAKLVKNYNDYAKELKSTTVQVSSAADDWLRAGKTMGEADALIKDSIMLSKLGQIDSGAATEDLLATMNGFNMSVEEVGTSLDAMVAVDMRAATSAGDIATALKYCASSADVAGVSFNKLVGMISATQDKTQQSAETIGTFTNTILSRYRDVKIGKYLSEDGDDISDYESVLKSIGISLRDNQGEFRDFEMILGEMAEKWDYLSSKEQNALIKVTSGTRQANRMIALLEGYNKVLELTEVAANSAGTAVEKFNNSYTNSLEAKKNTLQASFESMVVNSDMEAVYSGVLDATTALVEFIDKTNTLKGVFAGLTTSMALKFFMSAKTGAKEAYLSLNQFSNALKIVKQTNIPTGDFDRLLLLSKNLSSSQMKLLLSSKNLTLAQKEQILVNSGLSAEEAKLQLQTWGMATAQNGLTVATTSLANAFRGLMASIVANPIILLTTLLSGAVMAYQSYTQKIEEARQKNIEAGDAAKENADSLRELYLQYEQLNSITNKTESQEEQFKQAVIDITKALGDKASVLENLTAGTDDYTSALKNATKAELESQYATAKIGAKAAEEELQSTAYSKWSGSKITIRQNEQMTGVEEHMAALNAVKDILKEYETLGMVGNSTVLEWKPIGFDQNPDDMKAVIEYYQALIQARDKLVTADNADFLMSSDIYKDINTTINELSDSVEKYTEQQYQALKLEYEWQNGIPTTEEEFKKMETSILNASGAGKEFQNILKGYLNEDFATFSESTNNINDMADAVDNATQSISNIKSFSEAWENLKTTSEESIKDLAKNLTELAESGQLTSEKLLEVDSTGYFENLGVSAEEAVQKINNLTDAATQLNALSGQISKMSDMLADKKNGTTASASDLAGFDAEVRGLDSWTEFEKVMGSTTSTMEECQAAANALASEWINNGNFLANLTEQNRDYYENQLKNMGIENAHVIILENLAKAGYELSDAEQAELDKAIQAREEIYALQLQEAQDFIAKKDLNVAAQDAYAGLLQEAEGAGISKVALIDLIAQEQVFNNSGLSVSSKISELSALASAYLGTAAAAQFAANTSVSGMGSDSRYFTPDYVMDQWTGALSNYKVNFDISSSGSSGYKGSSSKSSGSSSKDTKQTIEWIERLLDVLQKKIDQTKAKFDNLFTLKDKKNNLTTQITLTKNLLTATAKAAERYKKAASNVKLSDDLKKKVQNGSYDIKDYDSKTSDAINKYKDYYDKYKELKQKVDELTTDIRSLREERYQLYVDDAEAKIAKSQAYAELDAGNYKEQNKHLEYQKKQIQEQYKYLIKIAKLNKDSVEVAKLRAELQKELNDLTKQEFDNIANTYDNKIGLTNNKIQAFQDQIDLMEAKGQQVGSALYTKQMSLNNVNAEKLLAEKEKLIAKLADFKKGSDDWFEAQQKLFSIDSELVQIEVSNANLQKSINQLKFDHFDVLLNKLRDITDEADFLISMLDSDNFFDDNGNMTSDGVTAMGLTAQNYDTYLAIADKYKEQIAELNRAYESGSVDLETYNDKMREYKSGQQSAIKSAEDAKKAVIDYVRDGLEKQNDALEREIENRKKLLSQQKESRDFNKKMLDLNKEIARTEKQLAVLSGDDSEENRKTIRELKSKLEDLKGERDDAIYDKSIEDQQNALDKMVEDSKSATEQFLSDSTRVFASALDYVNAHSMQVSNNLEQISKQTGYDISSNITNAWKSAGNAVDTYEGILSGNIPSITSQISLITTAWQAAAEAAEKAAQAAKTATTNGYLNYTTLGKDADSDDKAIKLAEVKSFISANKHKATREKSHYASLNQYIYDKTGGYVLTKENEAKLADMLGVKIAARELTGEQGKKDLAKILKELKNIGYSTGGLISIDDALRYSGEDGIALVKNGEYILSQKQTDGFLTLAEYAPQLAETLKNMPAPQWNFPNMDAYRNMPIVDREPPVVNHNTIDNRVIVEGVATEEVAKEFERVAKKQAENVVAEINRRTYSKGVRWK